MNNSDHFGDATASQAGDDDGITLGEIITTLRRRLPLIVLGALTVGAAAIGVTYLIPPVFTAKTVFMPPQQAQSSASAALASLGALSGLAGGASGLRSPVDQYIALMQSVAISDRIVEQFKLQDIYDVKLRVEARAELAKNARMVAGKKDGLISVEVDDTSPQRAADIANRYVDELRRMTAGLAMTEAQQRRAFFERQMQQTRDKLTQAQQVLQASGFTQGALNAEPKAAAEGYARVMAQATAAEVRLQVLRNSLADDAPEIRQQQAALAALRSQLAQLSRAEAVAPAGNGTDYISKYREFKFQETLFELYARQFELARIDESRESALIQVIDVATPPEKKSKPMRGAVAVSSTLAAAIVLSALVLVRHGRRRVAGPGQSAMQTRPA